MLFGHMADLVEPDLDEYLIGRAMFENTFEETTPEELEKASWDYDSETGRRYSEDESEDDSNSESEHNSREETSASEDNLQSHSSSEDSIRSQRKTKRRTKKIPKSSPTMMPVDQYKKDMEELSNRFEEYKESMETRVRDMSYNYNALEKKNLSKEKEFNEMKNLVGDLKRELKSGHSKNAKLEAKVESLEIAKETFEKKKEFNRKESDEVKEDLKQLHALIKEEKIERQKVHKILDEKCSKIESLLEKQTTDDLAENSHTEVPMAGNDTIKIEDHISLAVTNSNNIKQHGSDPHSVAKPTHNTNKIVESQQSSDKLDIDNTSTHKSEVGVDNIVTNNLLSAGPLNQKGSENKTKAKGNLNKESKSGSDSSAKTKSFEVKDTEGKPIIDRISTIIELFIKETFNLINILIENGMGWCILFIILLHCKAARAAV